MMRFPSFFSFLLLTVILHACLHQEVASDETKRETLEIIIGGGGEAPAPAPDNEDCDPPDPPPPPPPPAPCKYRNAAGCFENQRLKKAYEVIQNFKMRIRPDANSIKYTRTWNGNDVCKYQGFRCEVRPDVRERAVAAIDFNGAKFAGRDRAGLPLKDFIDQFEDLAIFHANSNNFTGTVPFGVSKIKYLHELDLSNNTLTGCLPYEIGNLKQAISFNVGSNKLTGPIPYSFGCLKMIELLHLANNEFYGEVPEIVCKLSKLENFSLSNNYFTKVGPACRNFIKKKILDVRKNCILDLPSQRSKAECAAFFSRKLYCERKETFKRVPCMKGGYNYANSTEKSNQESTASAPSAGTYSTLIPDRL